MAQDPQSHITNHLLITKSLPISPTWLSQFLSAQRVTTTPISAVTQTALFRILASDFTTSISTSSPTTLLPIDISDPAVKERRLIGNVPVQVLDLEDIGTSLWSQFEAIERIERGEETRGREIIRTVDLDQAGGQGAGTQAPSQAPAGRGAGGGSGTAAAGRGNNASNVMNATGGSIHRLVLQDAAGTKVVGIELRRIDGISVEKLSIGAKLVLKAGATVARGVVLMEPATVTILGGKIEAMHSEWKQGRKARILARLEQSTADADAEEG
jgi:RecQ-mediated genome instability protein 1